MTKFDRSRPAFRRQGKVIETQDVPAELRAAPRAPAIPKATARAQADALVERFLQTRTITKLPAADPAVRPGKPVPLPPPRSLAKKPTPDDLPF